MNALNTAKIALSEYVLPLGDPLTPIIVHLRLRGNVEAHLQTGAERD